MQKLEREFVRESERTKSPTEIAGKRMWDEVRKTWRRSTNCIIMTYAERKQNSILST